MALLLTAIAGCKLTGNYFMGDGFNNTYLALHTDSTFVYKTFSDVGGTDTISGRWTRRKNMVILNSSAQPEFKANSISEKVVAGQAGKLIIVQNMDVSAHRAVISINNGAEVDTLTTIDDITYWNDSFALFVTGVYTNIKNIKSIRILNTNNWTDCVLKDSVFYTSNPKANVIVIYTQPYNQYSGMHYLVDAEWKFGFNRIYIWRTAKRKWAKNVFLRKRHTCGLLLK